MNRRRALFWSVGLLAVVAAGGMVAGGRYSGASTCPESTARFSPFQPANCASLPPLVLLAAELDDMEDGSDGDDVQALATVHLPVSPAWEIARAASPLRHQPMTLHALRIRLQI